MSIKAQSIGGRRLPVAFIVALVVSFPFLYLCVLFLHANYHSQTPLYRGFHLDHWLRASHSESTAEADLGVEVLAEVVQTARNQGVMCCSPFCIFSLGFHEDLRREKNGRNELAAKIRQVADVLSESARSNSKPQRIRAVNALSIVRYYSDVERSLEALSVLLEAASDSDTEVAAAGREGVIEMALSFALSRDSKNVLPVHATEIIRQASLDAELKPKAEAVMYYFGLTQQVPGASAF